MVVDADQLGRNPHHLLGVTSEVSQRSRKFRRNPSRLCGGIGVGVVGMKLSATPFLLIVLHRPCQIRPQVISKRQVPFDLAVSQPKAMQLEPSSSGGWLVERVVPSAGYSVFAPMSVAKLQEHGFLLVQFTDTSQHRHQVNYRLGVNPGDRRRSDVVNHDQVVFQGL